MAKKSSSRSAAAKKAWATRRKLYGKSGISKGMSHGVMKKKSFDEIEAHLRKRRDLLKKKSYNKKTHYMKYGNGAPRLVKKKSKSKSRGRMRIYTEGGGYVTAPR